LSDTGERHGTSQRVGKMEREDRRIPARDGFALAATVHAPDPRTYLGRVVIVASAMGVKRSFYDPMASFLAGRGIPVVTFDYRGIGGSRPARLRGFRARLRDWGQLDLAGVIAWAHGVFPEADLYVVAHSVGGQILGLADGHDRLRGVLAIACQSGYWGHWRGSRRIGMFVLWYAFMPALARALGYFPSRRLGLGEDLPAGVAREWAWWGRHPRYVLGRLGDDARRSYDRFAAPILAYSFGDDGFAPRRAVRAFLDLYPGAPRSHRHVEPRDLRVGSIGHFGFFRDEIGSVAWPHAVDWMCSVRPDPAGVAGRA
jgi:predicted alpha/beta hydrolase